MHDRPSQPNLDDQGILQLERLRADIGAALDRYQADPVLRRAFIQAAGALDQRLGRPPELPNRRERRRQGIR